MAQLTNKTAVITGGTTGIGFETAKQFVAEGARVIITGQNDERLQAAVKELGEAVIPVRANVRSLPDLEALAAQVKAEFGGWTFCLPMLVSGCLHPWMPLMKHSTMTSLMLMSKVSSVVLSYATISQSLIFVLEYGDRRRIRVSSQLCDRHPQQLNQPSGESFWLIPFLSHWLQFSRLELARSDARAGNIYPFARVF
jgi:hypothetical protein